MEIEAMSDAEDGNLMSMAGLAPDHPLLARAQQALDRQLRAEQARKEIVWRETQEELRQAEEEREQLGVDLYSLQHQLANLQVELEKAGSSHFRLQSERIEGEETREGLRRQLDDAHRHVKGYESENERLHMEVEKVNSTLQQVDAYNKQMKSEIAVTRRATYVTEEAVARAEKEKLGQDLEISTLQTRLNGLQQTSALYDTQIKLQREEASAAREALADAQIELETVSFEKRQLLAQWRSALTAVGRRDEALAATGEAIWAQIENAKAMTRELEGYSKSISSEHARHERLTAVLAQVHYEHEHLSKAVERLQDARRAIEAEHSKLKYSLSSTEEAARVLQGDRSVLERELERIEKDKSDVANETLSLGERLLDNLSSQTTVEKAALSTAKEARALQHRAQAREMDAFHASNEAQKLRIDVLNTLAHTDKLRNTLLVMESEMDEKEHIVDRYNSDVRRRNDQIEKRTSEVDRLNRELERLTMTDAGQESLGPLEHTISNLRRLIDAKDSAGRGLQRKWMDLQTELVRVENANVDLHDSLSAMRAEQTLQGKKLSRLDRQLESNLGTITELDRSRDSLWRDTERLNALIAQNVNVHRFLSNENLITETDIVGELRVLESEAAALEDKIADEKLARDDLLSSIVESERHIMLWERKITVERESQETINPSEGEDVVRNMKKEIHRMKLRYTDLLKKQERILGDMEKAISKRDTVLVKKVVNEERVRNAVVKRPGMVSEKSIPRQTSEISRRLDDIHREASSVRLRSQEASAKLEDLVTRAEEAQANLRVRRQDEDGAVVAAVSAAVREGTGAAFLALARIGVAMHRVAVETARGASVGSHSEGLELLKGAETKRELTIEALNKLAVAVPVMLPTWSGLKTMCEHSARFE